MRKFFLIALSALYIFSNTELTEVFKVPRLLTHYQQHHVQNASVTFWNFLVMHYAGDDGTKADDNEDLQLPFHSVNKHCMSSLYTLGGAIVQPLSPAAADVLSVFPHTYERDILSSYTNLVFQPPRFS